MQISVYRFILSASSTRALVFLFHGKNFNSIYLAIINFQHFNDTKKRISPKMTISQQSICNRCSNCFCELRDKSEPEAKRTTLLYRWHNFSTLLYRWHNFVYQDGKILNWCHNVQTLYSVSIFPNLCTNCANSYFSTPSAYQMSNETLSKTSK